MGLWEFIIHVHAVLFLLTSKTFILAKWVLVYFPVDYTVTVLKGASLLEKDVVIGDGCRVKEEGKVSEGRVLEISSE